MTPDPAAPRGDPRGAAAPRPEDSTVPTILLIGPPGDLRDRIEQDLVAGGLGRIVRDVEAPADALESGFDLLVVAPADASGLARLLALRQPAPPRHVPALLISSAADLDGAAARSTSGRDICLAAPVDAATLTSAAQVLARSAFELRFAENLDLMRNLARSTPDAIYIKDLEGRYLFANQVALQTLGKSESELLGRDDRTLLPPEMASSFRRHDAAAVAAGEPVVFEEIFGTGTQLRVFRSVKAPLRGASGEILGLIGVSRDVTDASRAEAGRTTLLDVAREIAGTLDRAELIRRVQQHAATGLPCDRVLTYFATPSGSAFELAGHHGIPADLLGDSLALTFQPGEAVVDHVLRGETATIDSGSPGALLPQMVLDHFRIRSLAAVPLPVHGRVIGALVAVRDERSERGSFRPEELRLVESIASQVAVAIEAVDQFEQREREAEIAGALARVGRELISSLDRPGLLEQLCELTIEVLGCDVALTALLDPRTQCYVPVAAHGVVNPEAWEGARLLSLPRHNNPELMPRLERGEILEVTPDGMAEGPFRSLARALGFASLTCIPLRRGDEMLGLQVAIHRKTPPRPSQIRERIARGFGHLASLALAHRRLIEELERANAVKSDFVATMSHELRTPLAVIIGYNDLLLEGAFGPLADAQVPTLRRTGLAARELLDMIDNTLDLSRIEAARATLHLAEVPLPHLFDEVWFETRELSLDRNVPAIFSADPDLPALRTDRAKLKMVLRNLVTNALKFTERGTVTVMARPADGGTAISVRDTGIGIPAESLPRIFEAFRQAGGEPPRHRHGGVGLGLYIVRRLVDLLGGRVTVETEVGHGSTFVVWLPSEPGTK